MQDRMRGLKWADEKTCHKPQIDVACDHASSVFCIHLYDNGNHRRTHAHLIAHVIAYAMRNSKCAHLVAVS
jgi:hypothetical protein